jgi:putative heme-binding domain-containing protein
LTWRYLGWQALKGFGAKAEPAITKMVQSPGSPTSRARGLWLLGKIDIPEAKKIAALQAAFKDPSSDVRCTAIRLLREIRKDIDTTGLRDEIPVDDPAPEVRREILLGLRDVQPSYLPKTWAQLAAKYEAGDRWYLEALGIAAEGHWDDCLTEWMSVIGGKWQTPAGRDIVWRSRATQTANLLADAIGDPSVETDQLPRYFRALDFQKNTDDVVQKLAFKTNTGNEARKTLVASEAVSRIKNLDLAAHPELKSAVDRILDQAKGTVQYVRLIEKMNITDRLPELLAMAQANPESQMSVEAIKLLIDKSGADLLKKALASSDVNQASGTIRALGAARDNKTVPLLMPILRDKSKGDSLRRDAVTALGASRAGSKQLSSMAEDKSYEPVLKEALAAALHGSQDRETRALAERLFPLAPGKDNKPLPPVSELITRKGDAANGRVMFHTLATCSQCHVVNGLGKEVGPNLSEIGKKLSKQAFYESILYPSAGISHNYESWVVATTGGDVLNGLITSETADEITLKDAKAILRTIKKSDIENRKKSEVSLMPGDVQKLITEKELVDIVEYLTTLKEAAPAAVGK